MAVEAFRQFYVDANVFLYTAQGHIPDYVYFCRVCIDFLDNPQGDYFVSDLIFREVDYRLTSFPRTIKGPRQCGAEFARVRIFRRRIELSG